MKTFCCDGCGALVFFENVQCLNCRRALGFLPAVLDLSALEPLGDGIVEALSAAARGLRYRACDNGRVHQVCNWLVPVEEAEPLCASCRLNALIPNLDDTVNRERWFKLEQAKRRLLYTLMRLKLPLEGLPAEERPALRFQFLAATADAPVITGHSLGLITLDIAEADDAERERRRLSLHEPYRTVLGHLRHEVGHYYWDRLVGNTPLQEPFRRLFGDESVDYGTAINAHYTAGAKADWPDRHVSAYASAHPWEDWAETWAHYLHIVDTLETAANFGLRLGPRQPAKRLISVESAAARGLAANFDQVLAQWLPLTYALNSLNRGMGLPDLYPFVLSPKAVEKLGFVHDVVSGAACVVESGVSSA